MAEHFQQMHHGDIVAERIATGVFDLDACLAEVDAHLSRNGFGGDEHAEDRAIVREYARDAFHLAGVAHRFIADATVNLDGYRQEHARRAMARSISETMNRIMWRGV